MDNTIPTVDDLVFIAIHDLGNAPPVNCNACGKLLPNPCANGWMVDIPLWPGSSSHWSVFTCSNECLTVFKGQNRHVSKDVINAYIREQLEQMREFESNDDGRFDDDEG